MKSKSLDCFWAYVSDIKLFCDDIDAVPSYYHDKIGKMHTWFKIVRFEKAPKNIKQKCLVLSSKRPLSEASKWSMCPWFNIEAREND